MKLKDTKYRRVHRALCSLALIPVPWDSEHRVSKFWAKSPSNLLSGCDISALCSVYHLILPFQPFLPGEGSDFLSLSLVPSQGSCLPTHSPPSSFSSRALPPAQTRHTQIMQLLWSCACIRLIYSNIPSLWAYTDQSKHCKSVRMAQGEGSSTWAVSE